MLYKEFDAATTPIEGRMLLEASAGTGKTYSLMRVLLRLLVDSRMQPLMSCPLVCAAT